MSGWLLYAHLVLNNVMTVGIQEQWELVHKNNYQFSFCFAPRISGDRESYCAGPTF